jgi:periplasmic divalent cation tolerance protein
MSHAVVLVTASSAEEAERIGRALVDERLAACANVVPGVVSTYWWQGRVEAAEEALIILKTRQDLVGRLTDRVKALHSYTVPEVIALPIVEGNPDYLRWIDESVAAGEARRV